MSQRAYDQIPIPDGLEDAVQRGMEEGKRLKRIKRRKKRLIGIGGAAAVFAAAVGVCYSNPAMAGKIPLIGHIFQRVEQSIPYPGDYSKKSSVLQETEKTLGEEETKGQEEIQGQEETQGKEQEQVYTASDQGITLTASEVYWNATQINLTVAMEYDRMGEMGFYHNGYKNHPYDTVQMMGSILVNGKEIATQLAIEGKQTDGTTFAGVGRISIDQLEEAEENLTLEISIDQIWWNDATKAYQGQEGASSYSTARYCQGGWNLKIPVSEVAQADPDVQRIPLQETNQEGLGFGDLTVTDYEIAVELIQPDWDEQQRKDFYEKVKAQAEKALGQEAAQRFYADAWLEPEDELHCGVAAFDQDGNRLENVSESSFQTEGRAVTKVSLFLLADDITAIKAKDLEQVRACAVFEMEVEL